ncbi:hypothetical protein PGIGA_G00032570 [Pangasianodon gigas]|uniref:Uncharacterized protein n=1 Tax=Pangasianodon gigas TaxID=30993 RepID=A0ACC5WY62_PANGG|nr:hypothetical protein [Pangasianodon gigas]
MHMPSYPIILHSLCAALQYEAPAIDGVKSVDQFGDGEVQPQPIAPLVDGVGEGPASYVKGGVRAESVSLPAAPTDGPFTGSAVSLGNPAYFPVDTPTEAVTPQHIPVQQNLKGPQLPQDKSWTGGKELKHDLKGFFGNGYHGEISDAASILGLYFIKINNIWLSFKTNVSNN